ncbi:hypothetical protein [Corynebacterium callunae]|uniref:hypothetical protein n=1 Tax=Corynebacterium callunae TaxID=1721 RepID=UPI001FFE7E15|nr:hypothetical protein [Corynebacterium callunae]MCK2200163.1 hypothetical protein [Corynebacterium callunae]
MTIFLDADDRLWIVARTRRELFDTLLEHIDSDDDDHLLRLAVACLGREEEGVMWAES